MKATLEFDLDDQFDEKKHRMCLDALRAHRALNQIMNEMRQIVKYEAYISEGTEVALPSGYHEITSQESALTYQLMEDLRSRMFNIIDDEGVDLENLF